MKNFSLTTTQKTILVLVALMAVSVDFTFAQNGVAGLTAAATELKRYNDPVTKICFIVGSIVGVVGGYIVFQKWNHSEPDATKATMIWLGALIFLALVPTVVKGFFG